MLRTLAVITQLALTSSVFAQSSDTGIAAIEAHFKQSGLEPTLLQTFDPQAVLDVSFDGAGKITPGQKLTVPQVQPTPELTLTPANSSVQFSGDYTIVMTDADVAGTTDMTSITRHWLINGAKIENKKVTNASASAITTYAAPLPDEGSGPHRYVILVYAQPQGFSAPADPAQNAGVGKWNFNEYIKAANLQGPVAANYLQVEQGTATVSVSPTSEVASSTLAAASTSGSAASSTSSGASASSTSSPNGAASIQFGLVSTAFAVGFSLFMTSA